MPMKTTVLSTLIGVGAMMTSASADERSKYHSISMNGKVNQTVVFSPLDDLLRQNSQTINVTFVSPKYTHINTVSGDYTAGKSDCLVKNSGFKNTKTVCHLKKSDSKQPLKVTVVADNFQGKIAKGKLILNQLPQTITCDNAQPGTWIYKYGESDVIFDSDYGKSYLVVEDGYGEFGIRSDKIRNKIAQGDLRVCTSHVTNMENLFRQPLFSQSNFNGDIRDWDTSHVTNMKYMFGGANTFNQDISAWDVSNVRTMKGMFRAASDFNQPIGQWDTSNVANMSMMFDHADSFNQSIDQWDTLNVKSMRLMFGYARNFNQDISKWDVNNVNDFKDFAKGSPIEGDVKKLPNFDDVIHCDNVQPGTLINRYGKSYLVVENGDGKYGIKSEDIRYNITIDNLHVCTSHVTNMENLFNSRNFNGDIHDWDTSNVTNMRGLFAYSNFNEDISNWDTSNVINMKYMFSQAHSFNQPIGQWDTSNVTDMELMFGYARNFNQDISEWDVNNVVSFADFAKNSPIEGDSSKLPNFNEN